MTGPGRGLQIVAGRFVNAYSTNDWMLGIIFRGRYIGHLLVNSDNVLPRSYKILCSFRMLIYAAYYFHKMLN